MKIQGRKVIDIKYTVFNFSPHDEQSLTLYSALIMFDGKPETDPSLI